MLRIVLIALHYNSRRILICSRQLRLIEKFDIFGEIVMRKLIEMPYGGSTVIVAVDVPEEAARERGDPKSQAGGIF